MIDKSIDKISNLAVEFEERTTLNFMKFYKDYKPKLIYYLNRYTRDLELAEDYAEEAFIQALLNIKTYKRPNEGGAQANTWVYKIAENIVKKGYKDKARLPSTSLDKEFEENVNLTNLIPYDDGKHTEHEYHVFVRKAEIIKDAIYNLPQKDEKYKQVLIMRELEGMAYKEISECLDINLSTIKSQIRKGRSIIRKKVNKTLQKIDRDGLSEYDI
jgi:RNA polymerase sigma-70 factor (ECF subfamily)